ncbi:hypothetical protein ES703_73084 [subsurface metagenome]
MGGICSWTDGVGIFSNRQIVAGWGGVLRLGWLFFGAVLAEQLGDFGATRQGTTIGHSGLQASVSPTQTASRQSRGGVG